MKLTDHLPPRVRARFKAWCSKGGRAGSVNDKVRAARTRWAKERKKKENSDTLVLFKTGK